MAFKSSRLLVLLALQGALTGSCVALSGAIRKGVVTMPDFAIDRGCADYDVSREEAGT